MFIRRVILIGMLAFWVPTGEKQTVIFSVGPAKIDPPSTVFPTPNPQDVAILEEKLGIAVSADSTTVARTLAVAKSFLGVPYVHGTLEQEGAEQVVVNLQQLDCWTFLENSLAIALASHSAQPAFDTLQQYVQQLRYWGGQVDGYASRIHYFSGWLLQAEKTGRLRDITRDLGGVPYRKKIGYMSARPKKYPPLQNPETRRALQQVEERISRHAWFYIPQDRVAHVEHLLRDGDIVALTSGKRDLDIAHQGFVVKKHGRAYLLHASSLAKKVVLAGQPLSRYVLAQKGQTGIIVARIEP